MWSFKECGPGVTHAAGNINCREGLSITLENQHWLITIGFCSESGLIKETSHRHSPSIDDALNQEFMHQKQAIALVERGSDGGLEK